MAMLKESMGERIKAERKRLNLTQTELGAAAGVKKAAVSFWECGDTKNLRPDNLFAIADKLKVNARWLALGEGPKELKATPTPPIPVEVLKLATRLVKMGAEERTLLIKIFESHASDASVKAAINNVAEQSKK